MARYYSEDPEYSQMTYKEKTIRDIIVSIMNGHTKEMEADGYYSSNPGVSENDYEDIADDIMAAFKEQFGV